MPERQSQPGGNVGRLVGPYELLRQIGSGGMGEVYLGRDRRLDRSVAVKAIRPDLVSDAGVRARFLRETRAASAIVHPFVATVFDVIEQDGETFLVMEHIQGTALESVLREGIASTPLERRLGYACEIAEALAAIHACGITHRDLKPSNVLVTPAGHVKVIDLGLARRVPLVTGGSPGGEDTTATSSMTSPGTVLGTLAWMSPEQLRGEDADARSDIFALGVILHQLLSGVHPFLRSTAADTISAILTETPGRASSGSKPSLSPAILTIRDRCLAKKREDRFGSAEKLAQSLRAAAQDEAIRAMSLRRRTQIGVALGATLLIGVGTTAGMLTWLSTPPTPAGPRVALAVVPFSTEGSDPDGQARGREVADLLAANLSGSRVVRVVGPDETEPLAAGLGPGGAPEELVARIGAGISVEYVLTGSLHREGGTYTATMRVLSIKGGGAPPAIQASAANTSDLAEKLGAQVRGSVPHLPVLAAYRDLRGDLRQWTSRSETARLHYEKGVLATKAGKLGEAIGELEAAIHDDPTFIRAQAALASVLAEAGYGLRAREAAAKAKSLMGDESVDDGPSKRLSLEIEAIWTDVISQPQQLIDITAQLVARYPDEPELLQKYARALLQAGRGAQALDAVDRALKVDSSRPSLYLLRAAVLIGAGRYAEAVMPLDTAERLFRQVVSEEGLAAVAIERGHLFDVEHKFELASREYARAIATYDHAGRDVLAADARRLASGISIKIGNTKVAEAFLDQAEQTAARAVNPALLCRVASTRGAQAFEQGEYGKAETLLRGAVDSARRLQLPPLLLDPLSNLGDLLNYTDRPDEAKIHLDEVLALADQLLQPRYRHNALLSLADIDYAQGRIEPAIARYEEVVGAKGVDKGLQCWGYLGLGELRDRQGKLEAALASAEGAVSGYTELGIKGYLGYALARRSSILRALGRNIEARRDLEAASKIATSPKGRLVDLQARCALIRSDSGALDRRWKESLAEAERALQLSGGVAGLIVPAQASACRALLELGRTTEALGRCRSGTDNTKAQLVERILVRSYLVESLVRAGRPAEARREAEKAMVEAETTDVPLASARIAAAVESLPPQEQLSETSAFRARGLAALETYIAAAPEVSRDAIRERADVKELARRLRGSSSS